MTRLSPLGTAVLGSGIIAITYGLARFVFGLFLPAIREDMGLTPVMAGFIGALPFASFITAIVVAPFLARALGLRHAAALTTGFALLGLLAIAQAPGPLILAAGVVTCGISTGLSSPIMAQAVATTVTGQLRGRVNATVNAGTSFGIAVAVVVVLLGSGAWRSAYLGFAVLAALGLAAAMRWLPGASADAAGAQPTKPGREQWREIARLSGLAAAMGFTSAIYWVFAPDFAIHGGGLDSGTGAWMWLTVGCVGLAGGAVGGPHRALWRRTHPCRGPRAARHLVVTTRRRTGRAGTRARLRRRLRGRVHGTDRLLSRAQHPDPRRPPGPRARTSPDRDLLRPGGGFPGRWVVDQHRRLCHRVHRLRSPRPDGSRGVVTSCGRRPSNCAVPRTLNPRAADSRARLAPTGGNIRCRSLPAGECRSLPRRRISARGGGFASEARSYRREHRAEALACRSLCPAGEFPRAAGFAS
ncbi:MAG: MFS transporter [Arhodomonas sp.]|nr:MFS transporter [Arhodomonas sp.]